MYIYIFNRYTKDIYRNMNYENFHIMKDKCVSFFNYYSEKVRIDYFDKIKMSINNLLGYHDNMLYNLSGYEFTPLPVDNKCIRCNINPIVNYFICQNCIDVSCQCIIRCNLHFKFSYYQDCYVIDTQDDCIIHAKLCENPAVVDGGGCSLHRCMYNNCPAITNKKGLSHYSARQDNSGNERICDSHKCKEENCLSLVKTGNQDLLLNSILCDHMGKTNNISKIIKYAGATYGYCIRHACIIPDCNCRKKDGYSICDFH